MKIKLRWYAVVEETPDYFMVETITDSLEEAETLVRSNHFQTVKEVDLGELVADFLQRQRSEEY